MIHFYYELLHNNRLLNFGGMYIFRVMQIVNGINSCVDDGFKISTKVPVSKVNMLTYLYPNK